MAVDISTLRKIITKAEENNDVETLAKCYNTMLAMDEYNWEAMFYSSIYNHDLSKLSKELPFIMEIIASTESDGVIIAVELFNEIKVFLDNEHERIISINSNTFKDEIEQLQHGDVKKKGTLKDELEQLQREIKNVKTKCTLKDIYCIFDNNFIPFFGDIIRIGDCFASNGIFDEYEEYKNKTAREIWEYGIEKLECFYLNTYYWFDDYSRVNELYTQLRTRLETVGNCTISDLKRNRYPNGTLFNQEYDVEELFVHRDDIISCNVWDDKWQNYIREYADKCDRIYTRGYSDDFYTKCGKEIEDIWFKLPGDEIALVYLTGIAYSRKSLAPGMGNNVIKSSMHSGSIGGMLLGFAAGAAVELVDQLSSRNVPSGYFPKVVFSTYGINFYGLKNSKIIEETKVTYSEIKIIKIHTDINKICVMFVLKDGTNVSVDIDEQIVPHFEKILAFIMSNVHELQYEYYKTNIFVAEIISNINQHLIIEHAPSKVSYFLYKKNFKPSNDILYKEIVAGEERLHIQKYIDELEKNKDIMSKYDLEIEKGHENITPIMYFINRKTTVIICTTGIYIFSDDSRFLNYKEIVNSSFVKVSSDEYKLNYGNDEICLHFSSSDDASAFIECTKIIYDIMLHPDKYDEAIEETYKEKNKINCEVKKYKDKSKIFKCDNMSEINHPLVIEQDPAKVSYFLYKKEFKYSNIILYREVVTGEEKLEVSRYIKELEKNNEVTSKYNLEIEKNYENIAPIMYFVHRKTTVIICTTGICILSDASRFIKYKEIVNSSFVKVSSDEYKLNYSNDEICLYFSSSDDASAFIECTKIIYDIMLHPDKYDEAIEETYKEKNKINFKVKMHKNMNVQSKTVKNQKVVSKEISKEKYTKEPKEELNNNRKVIKVTKENKISSTNVFNSEIKKIVIRHSIASAAIAIIPGLGPTTATFNQSVMLGIISEEMGVKLSKNKTWHVVKKVGVALLAGKAVSMGASFLPGFGSMISAAIEGGATYAVAYVYVKMMGTLSDKDVSNMSDEEFEKIVDKYTAENKDDIKKAFEEGKKFYKENKDSVSKEEVEQIKSSVLAQSKKEVNEDSEVVNIDECGTIKCSKCGNDLSSAMKFCPSCGTPVSTDDVVNQKQDHKLEKQLGAKEIARRLCDISGGEIKGAYFNSISNKDDSKIEKAKKGYNGLCAEKDIIMCYDDTIFGSATDGFMLATDGIYIHDLGQDVIFVSADNMRGAKLLEGKDKIGMECPGGITCNIPVTIADTGKMFQFLSKVLNEEYL